MYWFSIAQTDGNLAGSVVPAAVAATAKMIAKGNDRQTKGPTMAQIPWLIGQLPAKDTTPKCPWNPLNPLHSVPTAGRANPDLFVR